MSNIAQGQYTQQRGIQAPNFITQQDPSQGQGYIQQTQYPQGIIGQQNSQGYGQRPTQQSTSTNLQEELANIQMLKAGLGGGGIGSTVGGGVGAAVGSIVGGPEGAAISAGANVIGSVVDWAMNNDTKKKAEKKRINARHRLLKKQKLKANADMEEAAREEYRGIAQTREEAAEQSLARKELERENYMFNIMNQVNKKAETDAFFKNKIINSRRV